MTTRELLYFADPMCSWCWGFCPVIESIAQRYASELPIRVFMGGLYPGGQRNMDEEGKKTIRDHWEHVRTASGQPFDFAFFERADFVYNTEPACRAVVTARRLNPGCELEFLKALHGAFYRDNRDLTDVEVTMDIAMAQGFDKTRFRSEFTSNAAIGETHTDFALARRFKIQGFPALIGRGEDGLTALSPGFMPMDMAHERLQRWQSSP